MKYEEFKRRAWERFQEAAAEFDPAEVKAFFAAEEKMLKEAYEDAANNTDHDLKDPYAAELSGLVYAWRLII